MARGRRGNEGRFRGIKRHDGAGLLEAIPEGFEPLAHGRQGIVIKQRAHPLPQQALAAQLGPHRLEQGATPLRGLIHHERQPHQQGTPHRQVLLAMTIVVFEVIARVFERIARLVCDLPPRSSTPHEAKDVALGHAAVRDPTAMVHLVIAPLPGLDDLDPHLWV